jgi:hypothetical protein
MLFERVDKSKSAEIREFSAFTALDALYQEGKRIGLQPLQ